MGPPRRARIVVSRILLASAFMLVLAGYLFSRRTPPADMAPVMAHFRGQIVTRDLQSAIAPLIARPDRAVSISDLPGEALVPAMHAVATALAIYPSGFVDKLAHRIVLAGQITLWNTQVGGFFVTDTIALNALDVATPGGEAFLADSFHHELSSIVRNQILFNVSDWTAANPPGFTYASFDEYKRVLAERPPVEGDDVLHARGFVSLYGTTSLDNDWNTYAERVFGHARDFAKEIGRFPKMRSKTSQLLDIYSKMDPRFESIFTANGLRQAADPAP